MQALEPPVAPPRTPAPRESQKVGVRRLVTRASLLILPLLAFLLFFEIEFVRQNPSHFAAKKTLLEGQAESIETLILGSSHALTGIDPKTLQGSAFNLASQSQSLHYDAALIRKYRPLLPALKRVVLPVSYFSLEYQLEDAPERWRAFHYRYFYDLPHRDWHAVVSARNFSAYFLSGETTRARVLLGASTNALIEYDNRGGWTNRPSASDPAISPDTNALRIAAEGTLRLHHAMMRAKHFPENVGLLDELIGELLRAGIDVVLVTLPVTRYYSAGVHRDNYQRMQAALQDLSARHHVRYLNWMNDPRFNMTDFADGDHLNWRGAVKYSTLLEDAAGF